MIEKGPATADEMILAFLRAEAYSPSFRGKLCTDALERIAADRHRLIDLADLADAQQNADRRHVLGLVRGYGRDLYIFSGFPDDTTWRLVTLTVAELGHQKYAKDDGWVQMSGPTRRVKAGVENLDLAHGGEIKNNVLAIAARLQQGDRFPTLIAAQHTDTAELILIEGHTRATAYVWAGLPVDVDLLVGTSPHMERWAFF